MKKILVPIILIAVFSTVKAWAQTERPASIEALRSEHDAQWYAHQAALWEKEVQKNPNDDEAWYYWFTFTKSKFANVAARDVDLDAIKEMSAIANRLHKERPDSYARYIIDFNYSSMFRNWPDYLDELVIMSKTPDAAKLDDIQDNMLKAIKMRPDFEPMYPGYVAYLVKTGRTDLMTDILKRWYNTGSYSYTMLSYAYNCLAGLEENGILFVSGEEETFACLLVQYGKGLFQDRLIINLNLLQEPDYLEYICNLLGVEATQPPADKTNIDYMNPWRENIIFSIAHTSKRPVYFTSYYIPEIFKNFLYSEGLVTKYSTKRYDNLAVKRRNYESVYLTDYMYETFVPDTFLDERIYTLNLNFIPCFKSLLDFYKAQGMKAEYDRLRNLMVRIVENCCRMKDVDFEDHEYIMKLMERYLNEIDR
jgi:hypothetical protein